MNIYNLRRMVVLTTNHGRKCLVLLMAYQVGCSCSPVTSPPAQEGTRITNDATAASAEGSINESQALRIAEKHYRSIGGAKQVTSTVEQSTSEGYWIHIEDVPATPGGHASVFVGFDGVVGEVIGGA
jgi:hypothetical protein